MNRRLSPSLLIWGACLLLAVVAAFVVVRIARRAGAATTTPAASSSAQDSSSVMVIDDAPSVGFLMSGAPPTHGQLPESCEQARRLRRQEGGYATGDQDMKLQVQAGSAATLEISRVTVERLPDPVPAATYQLYCNDLISAVSQPAPEPSENGQGQSGQNGADNESDGQDSGDTKSDVINVDLGGITQRPTATLEAPILLDAGAGKRVQLYVQPGDLPYAWRLHVTVQSGAGTRDVVVDDQGQPFGIAPIGGSMPNANDVAGEGWSDVAGLPNVYTVPGGPAVPVPDQKLSLYAGFGSGAAYAELVGDRQIAWRRIVRGEPPTPPKGMNCAQLYHWLSTINAVAAGGEPVVVGAATSGDVSSSAVIEDVHLRVLSRLQVPRAEQTLIECLRPEQQKSSGLANYRVDIYPGVTGEYPTSFIEATGSNRVLPGPPALLGFGNTVYRVFPQQNDVWQSYVLDLDIRNGTKRQRVTLDDNGSPFTSGSAWAGTAGRTLAYCADASELGWTTEKSACSTVAAAPSGQLSGDLTFLVGDWGGRYRNLTVNPDGSGELKLGNPPDDPSKPAADGTTTTLGIRLQAGLTARITSSDDPAVPVGGEITIRRLTDPGMIELTIPDGTWGKATFCNNVTAADPTACG